MNSLAAAEEDAVEKDSPRGIQLKYHDNAADGKKSLGGSGEMLQFSLPKGQKISGIKIHGSRYGKAQPPKEDFVIYILDAQAANVLSTQTAPYSLFERGDQKWVAVSFAKPLEVPQEFWLTLDFRAHQTKGVYVSYDTSTGGTHSRVSLPGQETRAVEFGGDWMIELIAADN